MFIGDMNKKREQAMAKVRNAIALHNGQTLLSTGITGDDARLAKAKFPVEWHVVASIPSTASGKVQKFRLNRLTDLATVADTRFNTPSPS